MTGHSEQGRELRERINSVLSDTVYPYKDYVLKNSAGAALNVQIKECRADEHLDIVRLQNRVYEGINNRETFVLTTDEELSESLDKDICLGVYFEGSLIAFTLMVSNRRSPRNLGYQLDYSDDLCQKCVTNDTTFVHPDYKGFGIQRCLLGLKIDIALGLGADEILTTVSPENTISLKNIISEGFEIATKKAMYGGFERYILRRTLISGN